MSAAAGAQRPAHADRHKRPRDSGHSRKEAAKKHRSSKHKHGAHHEKPHKAPTLIPDISDAAKGAQVKKKKSAFLCDIIYRNVLPEPPMEPNLIPLTLNPGRRLNYCASSLEKALPPTILTERMLGIPIDLIDQQRYMRAPNTEAGDFDEEDAKLLPDDYGATSRAKMRVKPLRRNRIENVLGIPRTWMEKVEYLDNNQFARAVFGTDALKSAEDKARALEVKQKVKGRTHEEKLESIEQTFRHARVTPKHPTNPDLAVEEVLHIFPDDALENFVSLVRYETHPGEFIKAQMSKYNPEAEVDPKNAIEHTMLVHANSNHHDMYARESGAPSENQRFRWIREYVKKPTPKVYPGDNFYFIFKENAPTVTYGMYNQRLFLAKRTKTANDPFANQDIESRPVHVQLEMKGEQELTEELFGSDDEQEGGGDGEVAGETTGEGDAKGEGETKSGKDDADPFAEDFEA